MPRFVRLVATALLALASAAAFSQNLPYGVNGKIGLLAQPKVKKELKITKDQDKAVQKMLADPASFGTSLNMEYMTKDADAKLVDVLEPAQSARLQELWFQDNDLLVLRLPEVGAMFSLSEDVQSKVTEIAKQADADKLAIFQKPTNSSEKKLKEIKAAAVLKIKELLTAEQQAAWTLALGKPFKF